MAVLGCVVEVLDWRAPEKGLPRERRGPQKPPAPVLGFRAPGRPPSCLEQGIVWLEEKGMLVRPHHGQPEAVWNHGEVALPIRIGAWGAGGGGCQPRPRSSRTSSKQSVWRGRGGGEPCSNGRCVRHARGT